MLVGGAAAADDRQIAVNPALEVEPATPSQTLSETTGHWPDDIAADRSAWRAWMDRWRRHRDNPADPGVRASLQLAALGRDVVQISVGRQSPAALAWRPGTFQHAATRHFDLLSRADREQTAAVAEDLERTWAVWTQLYFPLWAGRDGSTQLPRHTVVLMPDRRRYVMALAGNRVDAGPRQTIAASTGFYSDSLRISFFYPQSDPDARRHEVVHQLFAEATASVTGQRAAGVSQQSADGGDDFWLLEGIAGHFESMATIGNWATVGGWDSPRLQYARYATVIAGNPVGSIAQLRGDRKSIQNRVDSAAWYRDAIARVHAAADPGGPSQILLLDRLAEVYRVPDWRAAAGLTNAASSPPPRDLTGFLTVGDDSVGGTPTTAGRSAICLAGMPVTAASLATLATGDPLRWLDVSRLPADDAMVARWIAASPAVDQLSLEATAVTSASGPSVATATGLVSLDVSWTAAGDEFVAALTPLARLQTLYLTGTTITDASIPLLSRFKTLRTLDVQRTGITDAGLVRLARPGLELNPLKLQ